MALRNTSIWTHIDWSGEQPQEKAKLWLKRSKAALLHVSLCLEDGFDADRDEIFSLMKLLSPEIHRWGTLSLHLNPTDLDIVLDTCTAPAPLLRSLAIRCAEVDAMDQAFFLFDGQTPILRHLHLRSVLVPWDDSTLFDNLFSLYLADYEDETGPTTEQLERILRSASGLRTLTLDGAGIADYSPDDHDASNMISLPDLQYIQMTRLEREFYPWYKCIQAPNVHTVVATPCSQDSQYETILTEYVAGIQVGVNEPFPILRRLKVQYGKQCF